MASPDVNTIAKEIEAGYAISPAQGMAVMGSYFADVVEQSACRRGQPTVRRMARGCGKVHACMPPPQRTSRTNEHTVSVDGDRVVVDMVGRGTLKTGDPYAIKTMLYLEVRDGKIVAFESHQSPRIAPSGGGSRREDGGRGMTKLPKVDPAQGGLEIPPDILEAFKDAGIDVSEHEQ